LWRVCETRQEAGKGEGDPVVFDDSKTREKIANNVVFVDTVLTKTTKVQYF
jgi:hypothetical protein